MDENNLDAELLAVTNRQEKPRGGSNSDDSSLDGEEFGAIADSDNDPDDNDVGMQDLDNGSDDDDNDDEMQESSDDADDIRDQLDSELDEDDEDDGEDDDDDDDYGAKPKRKKKVSKTKIKKKKSPVTTKKTKGKRRGRPSGTTERKKTTKKSRTSPHQSDLDDEINENDFQYKYDKDGYGDAADREKLTKMKEVDRETILVERKDARQREYFLWKKKREMEKSERDKQRESDSAVKRTSRISARNKTSSKSDALEALAADKRNKSTRKIDVTEDGDSEGEVRTPPSRDKDEEDYVPEKTRPELEDIDETEGPELKYSDLVEINAGGDRITSPLFLRRDTIVRLSQEPYFERAVTGLFARIVVSDRHGPAEGSYLLVRIVGVSTGKVQHLTGEFYTNYILILQSGKQKRPFKIQYTSGSHPSEREFQTYRERALSAGVDIPRRDEVKKLLRRSQEMIVERKGVATEEEQKKHIANMEIVYPARINWTQKKTEAKLALDIRMQELSQAEANDDQESVRKIMAAVDDLEKRYEEAKRLEEQYILKKTETSGNVFQTLARRNMALNSTNDRLAASRKNLESVGGAVEDTFARVDTTGESYFSIKDSKSKEEAVVLDGTTEKLNTNDWRNCLQCLKRPAKKRKISEKAVDAVFDVEIFGLEDFDDDENAIGSNIKDETKYSAPTVDAIYATVVEEELKPPRDAKIIAFEEWSKQRMAYQG